MSLKSGGEWRNESAKYGRKKKRLKKKKKVLT